MAVLSLYLDTRYKRPDGCYLVKIKISLPRNRNIQINTAIRVAETQWDKQKGRVVKSIKQLEYNTRLTYKVRQAETVMLNLEQSGELYQLTPSDIKTRIEREMGRVVTADNSFIEFFREFTARKKPSTRASYETTLNKIVRFCDGSLLRFESVTYAWLNDFQLFMAQEGLSVNSQAIMLRNIRSVFNQAINEDRVSLSAYPFRKYKIKKEETRKRSLTIEQIRMLRDYDCEESQRQYRDMFMLIFYLGGINTVDLFHLTGLDNGYVDYQRFKTGRLYRIKVEPEAMEIIRRYKGKGYLINVLDRYTNYRDYQHRLNKNLQEIGPVEIIKDKAGKRRKKQKNGLFPELTTYWARHSWATIAAGLDIPKETIAAVLGHGGNSVTDIYIKFDQKKIDQAIRQVIDAVNGKKMKV